MAGYSSASWANRCARNGCITKDTPPPFNLPSTTFGYTPLKSARRYTNLSATEVRQALIDRGYPPEKLPGERTLRDILNRMNYRLKRIQKGKPLKKTAETDAIFANVKQVREQARAEPETLEISVDAKAKVSLGEYVRGGKNPDRQRR
jgi:hypothetical protein